MHVRVEPEDAAALAKLVIKIENINDEKVLDEFLKKKTSIELLEFERSSPSSIYISIYRPDLAEKYLAPNVKKDFITLLKLLINFLIIHNRHQELTPLLKYVRDNNITQDGKALIECKDNKLGLTSLLYAVLFNAIQCTAILLKFGADKNARSDYSDLLNEANAVVIAAQGGFIEILTVLLDKGMDPNSTDAEKRTALFMACYKQKHKCAELLLERKADPNLADKFEGWTPLHCALDNKDQELFYLLLKKGASLKPLKTSITQTLVSNGIPFVTSVPSASNAQIKQALIQFRLGSTEADMPVDQKAASDSKEAKLTTASDLNKEVKSGVLAEKTFFSINRQKKKQKTHRLKQQFTQNRADLIPDKIDVTCISARKIITADGASLQESVDQAGGEAKLSSRAGIQQNLKWAAKSSSNNQSPSYNVQVLSHSGTRIAYKHAPVPGHLGGFYMFDTAGSGQSGTYDDIIKLIHSITDKKPENEKALAKHMLHHAKTGEIAAREDLEKKGMKVNQAQYDCLKRICFLTSIKEVVRRLFPNSSSKVTQFPFALSHYRTLELIAHGHLKMAEVFSADAPYGLATGKGVTSTADGIQKAQEKIKRINRLYNETILIKTHPEAREMVIKDPFKFIAARAEEMHQELLKAYGGESDSDGITYLSENESTSPAIATGVLAASNGSSSNNSMDMTSDSSSGVTTLRR